MKKYKIFLLAIIPLLTFSCSEDAMDEVNKEKNNALTMSSQSMLPDVILRSAFESTGIDMAWYASVYIEHSAGTWAQSADQDRRLGQENATLFNNNWNGLYSLLMSLDDIIKKTGPEGDEENGFARGVAQILTAYNLAIATDMWGEIPWTEALKGSGNLQPTFDKQSEIYPKIVTYLNDGIASLEAATNVSGSGDYIYGGDTDAWVMAANSLKARFAMRLSNVDNAASTKALAAIADGFASADDAFLFNAYEESASGENPWYQFYNDRSHLSVGKTLFDLMDARNDDARMDAWFEKVLVEVGSPAVFVPAPNGTATETQGGVYSISLQTANGMTAATPMMTFHELKFIEAEAKFRTSNATWKASLFEAIAANYAYHGIDTAGLQANFTANIEPRLTAGNEIKEILTQKYIAFYEHEAQEAYNDYRRVPSFLTLSNPQNTTVGFVWRFPYADSEVSSNSANVPEINVFADKVWWAGGAEN